MGQIDQLSRAIGGLEAKVETLTRALGDKEIADKTHRIRVYERFDEINDKLNPLVADMREIKPLVLDHEQNKQRATGALTFARIVWAAVAGLGGAALTIIGFRSGAIH